MAGHAITLFSPWQCIFLPGPHVLFLISILFAGSADFLTSQIQSHKSLSEPNWVPSKWDSEEFFLWKWYTLCSGWPTARLWQCVSNLLHITGTQRHIVLLLFDFSPKEIFEMAVSAVKLNEMIWFQSTLRSSNDIFALKIKIFSLEKIKEREIKILQWLLSSAWIWAESHVLLEYNSIGFIQKNSINCFL